MGNTPTALVGWLPLDHDPSLREERKKDTGKPQFRTSEPNARKMAALFLLEREGANARETVRDTNDHWEKADHDRARFDA